MFKLPLESEFMNQLFKILTRMLHRAQIHWQLGKSLSLLLLTHSPHLGAVWENMVWRSLCCTSVSPKVRQVVKPRGCFCQQVQAWCQIKKIFFTNEKYPWIRGNNKTNHSWPYLYFKAPTLAHVSFKRWSVKLFVAILRLAAGRNWQLVSKQRMSGHFPLQRTNYWFQRLISFYL